MKLLGSLVAVLLGVVSAMGSEVDLEGIENCPNKCDKVFDKTQYAISDQPNQTTFEYRSCLIGCQRCSTELAQNVQQDGCFEFCKVYNYRKAKIRKGVIEPDKACIMGCVINTCQEICIGGTTDHAVTTANAHLWWGLGGKGCSIKGGLGYVQNPNYGNADAPQPPGASEGQRQCCTNAFNLCFYSGSTDTTNYANVIRVAQRSCGRFVGSTDVQAICTWYNTPRNCGQQGLPGFT